MGKTITLWIKPDGTPMYIVPEVDITSQEADLIVEKWEQAQVRSPIVLHGGWDIRVLEESK